MRLNEAITQRLTELPLGPWTAYGDTVYAGTKVVCVCPGPRGNTLATQLAKLPDMLRLMVAANFDTMAAEIDALSTQVQELEAALAYHEKAPAETH